MKTFTLIFLLIFILTFQIKSQPVWNPLNSGSCCSLYSIYFVDANTGFASGQDTILKTTNAGLSWYKQFPGTNNVQLSDIAFYNSNTGYSVGNNGTVIKTINGGVNWSNQTSGLGSEDLNSIFIINASELYIGGNNGKIYKSINGGNTWTLLSTGTTETILSIYFVNGSKGYASATNGVVLKTDNGGVNWTSQVTGYYWLNGIFFSSASAGFAVGGVGPSSDSYIILKTANSGQTWTVAYSGSGYRLNKIYMFNSQISYAVGTNGKILRTIDGGLNWVNLVSGTDSLLYDVCFTSNEVGYVSGSNGIILKTTNGLTLAGNNKNKIPHDFNLAQNYPNPFNPTTNINFKIPKTSFIEIVVYDIAGNEVVKLVNGNFNAGSYNVKWDASNQSTGVYFYKMIAHDFESNSNEVFIETKKIVLLK